MALVTETFPPEINGVAMTLSRLVTHLSRRHHVTVVRPLQPGERLRSRIIERTPMLREFVRPGVQVPRMGVRLGLPSGMILARHWRRDRPDIVHIATEGPLGLSALLTANALGIPLSSSFHTNFDDYTKHYGVSFIFKAVQGYLRRFHNRTRRTMVPSHDLINTLDRLGYRNLTLFSRGVDTALFSPARRDPQLRRSWGVGDAGLVLLLVGRVAPEKNIPLLVAAFDRIRVQRPDAKLVIVGEGPVRPEIQARFPQAIWTGAKTGIDLARHYASADLFAFPSMSETFGNVVLEAMASGVAPLAFNYAAPQRYVVHAQNGWLVPFGDEPGFIEAATCAAASPRTLRLFGERARETTTSILWDQVIGSFEATLYAVIREQQTAGGRRVVLPPPSKPANGPIAMRTTLPATLSLAV